MQFSIITASFNQGRFIRECIESVLSQGVEFEHIIVDACSTDETLDVLRQFPHLQWTSEPDTGQTDAINKGFRRARGELIMWLNADDYLMPGALAVVAAHMAANSEADIVYGDCDYVNTNGEFIRRKSEFPFSFWMLLLYGCYIPSTSTFFRRRIISAGHLPDPSYKVVMDYEYYLRLSDKGFRFSYLPKSLASFRWHESNVSMTHLLRRNEERFETQRRYMKARGIGWMAHPAAMKLLYRLMQAYRAIRHALQTSPRS